MFEPRLAIASLSGESDAAWAINVAEHIGAAFLGGIALDAPARAAAAAMVDDRDRNEFLPPDPFAFIESELRKLVDVSIRPGVNVRSTTRAPIRRAGEICAAYDAILEVNAHCRQRELCAVGCGETLLGDTDRLVSYVHTAAATGAVTSVKVRAEVDGVDLPATVRRLHNAGADVIHVDAMDSEPIIKELPSDDVFIIANNGVRSRETAVEYLEYGADAVSVGRPSDRPAVLATVRAATDEWFLEEAPV